MLCNVKEVEGKFCSTFQERRFSMKKRVISLVLVAILFATMSTYALARWQHTSVFNTALGFSGTTANCTFYIEAHNNSALITATARLIRINANGTETVLRTWSGLSGTGWLAFSDTHTVTRGLTYRFEVSATVRVGQSSERVSDSSTARCP